MAGNDNPFDPPRPDDGDATKQPTMMVWSVAVVFASALIGGLIGAGIGAALGSFLPEYYRSVFSGGQSPNFDPVAVGIGQGLTQGVGGGGCIGIVLVALFYWHRRSTDNCPRGGR
ncbi:MAG: hypothetical protein KDB00_20185 [Planctomycetales bacterium]|nr:hypothetical protein [Planctomycetales bacterium]